MQHEIRTIRPDELENLEKVASKVWHQRYDVLLGPEQVDYMLDMFQNQKAFREQINSGYIYRGMYANGELVGYTGSVVEEAGRVFLSKLYILEEYRNHGFGRQMINDVIHIHDGCDSVYLTVNKKNPVRKMYEYMGFKVVKSVVTDIGEGYVMDDYVMQWDISGTSEEDE